ncbi:hypothetical protein GMSM_18090 [Geomonas sp. Red276]
MAATVTAMGTDILKRSPSAGEVFEEIAHSRDGVNRFSPGGDIRPVTTDTISPRREEGAPVIAAAAGAGER